VISCEDFREAIEEYAEATNVSDLDGDDDEIEVMQ
jgi:hypothetical protein